MFLIFQVKVHNAKVGKNRQVHNFKTTTPYLNEMNGSTLFVADIISSVSKRYQFKFIGETGLILQLW